jgi:poly(3-hydroxybutyrate) depolymerase
LKYLKVIKTRANQGMKEHKYLIWILMFTCVSIVILFPVLSASGQEESNLTTRSVITFNAVEREYFVHKPQNFDSGKRYWLMVVVHGGGGNGHSYWLADGIRVTAADLGLDAIIVTPSFSNTDSQASRFPNLGEGAFLERVLEELHDEFRLHKKNSFDRLLTRGSIHASFFAPAS